MIPKRKKLPVQRTRLRFGRRESQAASHLRPFGWQTLATMDLSEYDEDLIELKRRFEAKGVNIQIPKRGVTMELPDPIDFGESLSDIVIRNRGKDPRR
ncbi:MAG: hypothetical protein ACJ8GN_18985 [Longimicrobiaceae bacterium]